MQQIDAKTLKQKEEKKESLTIYKKEAGKEEQDNFEEYEVLEREILPEKIVCPDCGGITWEGMDFCDKCGADLHNR